jgi:hypothetical protein
MDIEAILIVILLSFILGLVSGVSLGKPSSGSRY